MMLYYIDATVYNYKVNTIRLIILTESLIIRLVPATNTRLLVVS